VGEKRNYFMEVQEKLNDVFDVYEHVKGLEERDVREEEVYGLLIELVNDISSKVILFNSGSEVEH